MATPNSDVGLGTTPVEAQRGVRAEKLRPVTPTMGRSSMWSWGVLSLPPDLLEQSCRRIAIAAMAFASLWALGFVMNEGVARLFPQGIPPEGAEVWPMPGALIAGVGLVMSLAMVLIAARLHMKPITLLNVGLFYLVASALLIGILNQWIPRVTPFRVSWICIIVLAYPTIVPNTPLKTLAATLAAATMDPVGFGIALARGVPVEGTITLFSLLWTFLPNYACAVLAVVPVHIIRGLSKQVSRARELGSYKLGDTIGAGGMGEVYRAEHRMLARPAAVKVIRPHLLGASTDAAARVVQERFRREAEAAALLRSPHTIELYDFGVADDGTFYLVMELLDGIGLEELVERFGPIPAERAVHIILQACESLAEAHSRGLMHRDIKPSNIFTNRLGLRLDFVKVLDFGLVKAESGSGYEQTKLTAPEVTTGTPAFMAPEVALGEQTADHRLDVYSLGAVLYWLVTGQLVFEAANPIKMMHMHIQEQPTPPSQRTELPIPTALDAVVLAALAKKPDDRPADAAELARRLRHIEFAEPWTEERAQRWWDTHLPDCMTAEGPCNKGSLVPAMATEWVSRP